MRSSFVGYVVIGLLFGSPGGQAEEAPRSSPLGSSEAKESARDVDPAQAGRMAERAGLWKSAQELASAGKTAEAIRDGQRVLELDQALFGPTAGETQKTAEWLSGQHQELGLSYENGEEWERAKEEYQRGVEVLAAAFGAAHWRTREAEWRGRTVELLRAMSADDRSKLAAAPAKGMESLRLKKLGQYREAVPLAEEVLALRERLLGDHPYTAKALNNLAALHADLGDYPRAEPLYRRCLEIWEKSLGLDHPDTRAVLNNLAILYFKLGDSARAESLLKRIDAGRAARLAEREKLIKSASAFASLGQNAEALREGHKVLELDRALFGPNASETRATAEWLAGGHQILGSSYRDREQWDKAQGEFRRAVEVLAAAFGADHWKTRDPAWNGRTVELLQAMNADDRGAFRRTFAKTSEVSQLRERAEYRQALPLAEETLAVFERLFGDHPYTATALHNLATLCENLGDYARAEPLCQRSLALKEKTLGPDHPETAASLNNLAGLYKEVGKTSQAEPLYQRSVKIFETAQGPAHPSTAAAVNNLASLYQEMGDYTQAESLYQRSLEIRERSLGPDHPNTANSLNNLAGLYEALGDYARAERLYQRSLNIFENEKGPEHLATATVLLNLAGLCSLQGDYAKAEPLYQRTLKIHERALGPEHPNTAAVLNSLAAWHYLVGDHARAEQLYLSSLKIYEKALGAEHPLTAVGLSNLASLYVAMGDDARAVPLYERSLKIREKTRGPDHPDVALALNDLGLEYIPMGEFARAESLLKRSLAIWEKSLGPGHPWTAKGLSSLGTLYFAKRDFAQAESFERRSLEIAEKALGQWHPDTARYLGNLAYDISAQGEPSRAEPYYQRMLEITRRHVEAAATALSERQQLAMIQMFRYRLDAYVQFLLAWGGKDREAFAAVLGWKGATLVRQRAMRQAAAEPELAPLFADLQRVSRQWAALATGTPPLDQQNRWRERVAALEAEKERLEAELSRRSAAYREATEKLTVDQLLETLPAGAALVDFLEFTKSLDHLKKDSLPSPRQWKKERSLVAFVVRPGQPVRMFELGPIAPLSEAIDAWRKTFGMSPDGRAAGQLLRQKLWEPLLESLGDAQTVLVSPDGVLGRLPLGALPGREPGTYLIEDHRLALIPVPQLLPALVRDLGRQELKKELLLLGDVDYNRRADGQPAPTTPPPDSREQPRSPQRGPGDIVGGVHWDRLPGAAAEIAVIKDRYEEKFHPAPGSIEELTGPMATEERFRQLAPQCSHMHLATHGFFAAPDKKSALSPETAGDAERGTPGSLLGDRREAVRGYSPGLLSGLVFAGANQAGGDADDDGYLTADELAFLALRGVQLAAVSACETGLGEVAGGEGLLGIQRAFQVAGARTVVCSLWKVDDAATRLFMEEFYRNRLEKELSTLDAFREAQLWALKNPDLAPRGATRGAADADDIEDPSRLSPRLWAAFVLSGDWR